MKMLDESPPERVPQSFLGTLISVPATDQDRAEWVAGAKAENAKRRAWNWNNGGEQAARCRDIDNSVKWELASGDVYQKSPPVGSFLWVIGFVFAVLLIGFLASLAGMVWLMVTP